MTTVSSTSQRCTWYYVYVAADVQHRTLMTLSLTPATIMISPTKKTTGKSFTAVKNGIYYRPYGWERFALKVLGRYEDDAWLGKGGHRTGSSPGEWPVCYHGTAVRASGSIAQEGYNLSKGKRFLYGHGIYSTPSVEVASKYAQTFFHKGKKYQLVFQNRVSPKGLVVIDSATTGAGEYWVQPKGGAVRPYGVCIRSLALSPSSGSADLAKCQSTKCRRTC